MIFYIKAMKLIDSYIFLEKLRDLIYELLEYRDDFFRSAIYEQYCGVPYSWIRIFAHFQFLSHSDAYKVNYIAHTYCSETTSYIQMGSVIIPPYAYKIITVLMVCPKSI
jgi:hypothetical protein